VVARKHCALDRTGDTFHGSSCEVPGNSALDARNYFDGSKPPFGKKQFGAATGRAVFRQRVRLFGNYERLRRSLGVTQFDIVSSESARNGSLAGAP
jgi:hypothetical protein